MDKFQENYLNQIKECESDEEIADVISKIYDDGFEDGNVGDEE